MTFLKPQQPLRLGVASVAVFTWAAALFCGPALHAAPPTRPCPAVHNLGIETLYGIWQVRFDSATAPGASVLLERHAEHADSVQGLFRQSNPAGNDRRARLAGDLEDGELILDESEDGQHISAVWVGRPTENSCGREIAGTRREAGEERTENFIMRLPPKPASSQRP